MQVAGSLRVRGARARYAAAWARVLSNGPPQAFIFIYFFYQCSDVAVFLEKSWPLLAKSGASSDANEGRLIE